LSAEVDKIACRATATLRETSPHLKNLAALLHLDKWAEGHLTEPEQDSDMSR
jgi:hypothetical protein